MKKIIFAALFAVLGIAMLAASSKLNAKPKHTPAPPSSGVQFKIINSYNCPIYVTLLAASPQQNCAQIGASPVITVPAGATITYNWVSAPIGADYGAQICTCDIGVNCLIIGCPPCYATHAGPIQPPCCGQMQADWLNCSPIYTFQVHP